MLSFSLTGIKVTIICRHVWSVSRMLNLCTRGSVHRFRHASFHAIGFSDWWAIQINTKKPMILCARSASRSRGQSMTRRSKSENTWKVYSSVKVTRLYDDPTWPTHLFEKSQRCGFFFFFVHCASGVLIGWAGKLRSRGSLGKLGLVYKTRFFGRNAKPSALSIRSKIL